MGSLTDRDSGHRDTRMLLSRPDIQLSHETEASRGVCGRSHRAEEDRRFRGDRLCTRNPLLFAQRKVFTTPP